MHNPYGDMIQAPKSPQPQWGQQQQWGQGSASAPSYVSYGEGTPPPYQPSAGAYQPNELGALEDRAQLWLMVAVVGFWVGFGWISGPLAWRFGGKIRRKYRALGHHPCAAANWAWGLGMASTFCYLLGIAAIVAVISLIASAPIVM